jgi:hypothetical protein
MRARLSIGACLLAIGAMASVGPATATAGSISGKVTNSDEVGIADVYVCATHPELFMPGGGCDFSEGDGDYELTDVPPGTYVVHFEAPQSVNYVREFYDDKQRRSEATPLTIGSGAVTGIDAELATGGQITGRVTDADTGLPIEGVEACERNVVSPEVSHCDRTDSAGVYTIHSLATGSYKVGFHVFESPNYMPRYYGGGATEAEGGVVPVTAGEVTPDIDVEMDEGIQLTGTLTEAGTGEPVKWVPVCALDATTEKIATCLYSKEDGTYSLAGLPFGSYVVSFAVDRTVEEIVLHPDGYVRQYYDGKPTFAEADPVGGSEPQVITGLDALLVKGPEVFPSPPPGQSPGPPPAVLPLVTPLPPPLQAKPPVRPRKCKKGFRKKKVKGRYRCVRKQKQRPKQRR